MDNNKLRSIINCFQKKGSIMYAVIFKAETHNLDKEYFETAQKMRTLALEKYGCNEFISTSEEHYEIAISYWTNEEDIKKWKNDKEHLEAQKMGKRKWYKSYHVQIVKIIQEYQQDF